MILSKELIKILGSNKERRISRKQVVGNVCYLQILNDLQVLKKLRDYVKEKELQCEGEKTYFLPDDHLAPIFGKEKMLIISMNKYISEHLTEPKPKSSS